MAKAVAKTEAGDKRVVGADGGKYGTKIVALDEAGQKKQEYLRTKVDVMLTTNADVGVGEGHIVKYNNQLHVVGERASHIDYTTNKAKDHHKVAMLTAIATLLGDNSNNIDLYAGCPLSVFINKEERERYKTFLKGTGEVELEIDGKPHKIGIDRVELLPESLGFVYKDIEKNKKRVVGVLDIGGLNVNAIVFDKMNPILSTAFTINMGSMILISAVKKALNSWKPDANIPEYLIPEIIANGIDKDIEGSDIGNAIVKNVFTTHMDTIIEECRKYNWSMDFMQIACIGGGSVELKECIEKFNPKYEVSDSAIWDNAEAFYKVGEMISNGKV